MELQQRPSVLNPLNKRYSGVFFFLQKTLDGHGHSEPLFDADLMAMDKHPEMLLFRSNCSPDFPFLCFLLFS